MILAGVLSKPKVGAFAVYQQFTWRFVLPGTYTQAMFACYLPSFRAETCHDSSIIIKKNRNPCRKRSTWPPAHCFSLSQSRSSSSSILIYTFDWFPLFCHYPKHSPPRSWVAGLTPRYICTARSGCPERLRAPLGCFPF